MRWFNAGAYCLTGIYSGACALYVLAGYSSGLPVSGWSTPLVVIWLAAALTTFVGGIVAAFVPRTGALIAMGGSSLLAALFFAGILKMMSDVLKSRQTGSSFSVQSSLVVFGLVLPMLLTIASIWIARRTREFAP
jgi:hypothetical protein